MTGVIVTSPPITELPPGSTSGPANLPSVTYQYAVTSLPQTWTGVQTFAPGTFQLQTVGGNLSFPNGPDTLVGLASSGTLTNKTYDTAGLGNVFKINGGALLSLGAGLALSGTALANIALPSAQAGASYIYVSGDQALVKKRSNSAAAMVDTLPGTGTAVMASGWWTRVVNADTAAILAIGVATGANLDGNAPGFFIYLGPGQGATITSDGTNYFAIEKPSRCRLGAATTIYAGGTGSSNSNAGLATGTGALGTIQAAINFVMSRLDMNAQACAIQLADGNYTENLTAGSYFGRGLNGHTTGPVMIQGNSGAITNVSLQPTSGDAFLAVETGGFEWGLKNLKIAPPAGNGLVVDAGSWVVIDVGITFAATTGYHVVVENGGLFEPNAAYTIAGGAAGHLLIHDEGKALYAGQTVTLTGTPAFSGGFIQLSRRGAIQALGVTFSGAATGVRWTRDASSYFGISGTPDSLFPGNSNGTVSPAWAVTEGGTGLTAGTSGGLPYFNSASTLASSAALGSGNVVVGGGAGATPATISNGQLPATATNDDAAAGKVGEFVTSDVVIGSAVALTTVTTANVTSISLTAGDWDVWANGSFKGGATTTVLYYQMGISLLSAVLPGGDGAIANLFLNNQTPFGSITHIDNPVGPIRLSLNATTTVFLCAAASFGVSTMSAFGVISARRRR